MRVIYDYYTHRGIIVLYNNEMCFLRRVQRDRRQEEPYRESPAGQSAII